MGGGGALDGGAQLLTVVEGPDHAGDVLAAFVALAGDQDGVSWFGPGDGGGDGRGAVLFDQYGAALVGGDLGGSGEAAAQPFERSSSRLSSNWLLFPIALLILGALLVPLTIVGLERWRSRKAQRAYEASRQL